MGLGVAPARAFQSVGLIPDTCILTRTCPGPGSGRSTSTTFSTSAAGPYLSYSAAFMRVAFTRDSPALSANHGNDLVELGQLSLGRLPVARCGVCPHLLSGGGASND